MNEYKIKIGDTAKVEKLQEESYQISVLVQACDLVGIRVLDHVIIGGDGYMSFVDEGLMKEE